MCGGGVYGAPELGEAADCRSTLWSIGGTVRNARGGVLVGGNASTKQSFFGERAEECAVVGFMEHQSWGKQQTVDPHSGV